MTSTPQALVLGTRGSALATRQTALVVERLQRSDPRLSVSVRTIRTAADRHPDRGLEELPGVGFFVSELQTALLDREIDAAVHSMKDLPSLATAGLGIAAVTERDDPRDVLVSTGGLTLAELPAGARVGTSSPRRSAALRAYRRDLVIVPIRGNVETRIRKMDAGDVDAVCLAGAGLLRVGLQSRISEWLSPDIVLPAAGQGALGVQVCLDDIQTWQIVAAIDHLPTRRVVTAERAVLARLAAGCRLPVAAHATLLGERLALRASVASVDGTRAIVGFREGPADAAEDLGSSLADELLMRGGDLVRAVQEVR